jgi:hypothetical protein
VLAAPVLKGIHEISPEFTSPRCRLDAYYQDDEKLTTTGYVPGVE